MHAENLCAQIVELVEIELHQPLTKGCADLLQLTIIYELLREKKGGFSSPDDYGDLCKEMKPTNVAFLSALSAKKSRRPQ